MPRHFLLEAGVDPKTDFEGLANFSGSHDKTWALVESGAFQAGVLNEAVWDKAVEEGRVDTSKVREFFVTPAYFDYNWTARGDLDAEFGDGFADKVRDALLAMDGDEQDVKPSGQPGVTFRFSFPLMQQAFAQGHAQNQGKQDADELRERFQIALGCLVELHDGHHHRIRFCR